MARTTGSKSAAKRWPRRAVLAAGASLLLALLGGWFSGGTLSAQEGTGTYLIRLRQDAVIAHLRRTVALPPRRLNLEAAEAARYRGEVRARQQVLRRHIEAFPRAEVREQMDTVFNGLAVRLRPSDVAAIARLPEVAEVLPSVRYRKALDAAAPLARVPEAWSDARLGGEANAGAGVKIAIIDTGIDINHPMFQDPTMAPPPGFPRFTAPTFACPGSDEVFTNTKVIVARNYHSLLPNLDPHCDAMDRDGHGTFVAGIAAGRRAQGPLANIAGVAPRAFLGSYKVFGTPGVNDEASLEAVLKAMDDAVKDGMDIINLSLGAQTDLPPSLDPLAQAVVAAATAGVTVVAAAGNLGPATGTILSPGTSPAAITVGALSNARILAHPLLVSGAATVPNELQRIAAVPSNGPALSANLGPAPLADVAAVDPSASACNALPAASLAARIALIRRGGCAFATKVSNAQQAGAIAVVIYNNQFQQPPLVMDVGSSNQIPSVMIGNTDGVALSGFLAAAGPGVRGMLGAEPQSISTQPGNVASFSAAGPSTDYGIKPDLVAPGLNLYSAEQRNFPAGLQFSPSGFGSSSGTSFAAPLVAGVAALLKQANPSWTPAQIKSALVQTASAAARPLAEGTAGVLAYGGGMLDAAAALATPATVSPASLSFGARPPGSTLNQTIVLTVQNTGALPDTFTFAQSPAAHSATLNFSFTPASLAIPPGGTTTVSVQAVSPQPITGTVEGAIVLRSENTGRSLRIPYWGNFLLPSISSEGILNAASLRSGPVAVAAGSLVTILGAQMTAGASLAASSIPLPTSLAGVRVFMGGREAPLLLVSPAQIIAQVPQELAGLAFTGVQVLLNGVASSSALLTLAPTAPGIFAVNNAGTWRGAVLHQSSGRLVTPSDPARPGEILEVYATGLGPTLPPVASGQPAPFNPPAVAATPPLAMLGNAAAPVRHAGLIPSFVGIYQVHIEVPPNAPRGEVPLLLLSGGAASNAVTVSVGP